MTWTEPNYSRTQVDLAGQRLITPQTKVELIWDAFEVLSNWRGAHSFPLNTFQMYLRGNAQTVYPSAAVAQRLKRHKSIVMKLVRYKGMKLSRMQDIGGCRAVVGTVAQVRRLRNIYLDSRIKHRLVNEKDYISEPKASGYRSIHLVYRYQSDRKETYNGLLVELQLRSRIQHAWATAVEVVGTFLQQSLKSSEGPENWLEFFALTGSAFARLEGTPPVLAHPPAAILNPEIQKMRQELNVDQTLRTYSGVLQVSSAVPELQGAHYYLLELRPAQGRLTIRGYARTDLPQATQDYLEKEKEIQDTPGVQAVLVAADSLSALKRLYPNYFANTKMFLNYLNQALASRRTKEME